MEDEQTEKNCWWRKQTIQATETVISKGTLKSVLRTILEEIKPKDKKAVETLQKLLQIKNIS